MVPYFDKADDEVYYAVTVEKKHPSRPEDFIAITSVNGNTMWALLQSCWLYKPEDRPSAVYVRDMMKTITWMGLTVIQAREVVE